MLQVFLFSTAAVLDFQNEDGFPISEKLWPELESRFAGYRAENPSTLRIPVSSARLFLTEFYSRYELSQPQRRILRRLEQILDGFSSEESAGFTAVEVSEHRSRRYAKKS